MCEESDMNASSENDGNNFETSVRESQTTVYQRTHQIWQRQEVGGLPTIRVDHSFLRVFRVRFVAIAATVQRHTISIVFQETFLMFPVMMLQQQRKQEAQKLQQGFATPRFQPGEDLLHRDEEARVAHIQSIPRTRFVRSLPTVVLPSPVEEFCSRKFMVEPLKNSFSELQFEALPMPSTFMYWKTKIHQNSVR